RPRPGAHAQPPCGGLHKRGTRDGDPTGRRRIGQGPRVAPALLPFLRGGVAMAVLQPLIAMIGRAAAVNREPQLSAHTEEHTMTPSAAQYPSSRPQPAAVAPEALSTTELVGQIASKATLLLREEVELARVELKKDVAAEIAT